MQVLHSERDKIPSTSLGLAWNFPKMPKSDTWPGGIGSEIMTGIDSAGSCDSVVSVNSGFSNDSLEHLSAEEKACLMFLEETIDSLDAEDDSGLSNDEPDLPIPGNLTTKMAHLSASLGTGRLDRSPKHVDEELSKDTCADHKAIQNYLVPTPFVLANCCSMSMAKPGFPLDKGNFHPKPQLILSNSKPRPQHGQQHGAPHIPSEVNVVVIPPLTKPKEYQSHIPEGTTSRGPLSYEALVHLRRSASLKKTPLCPTLDHTIESPIHSNHGNLPRPPLEVPSSKAYPPAVAPKPKIMPTSVSFKTQNEITSQTPDSPSSRSLPDSQKVRLEALQKLGLLKDKEPEQDTVAYLSPSQSYTCWDLNANRFVRNPALANPSRSPSFSYSQGPTEPRIRPLQSSASFNHHPRSEQPSVFLPHPSQPCGVKAVTVERSGVGLRSHGHLHPAPLSHSTSLGSQRSGEHYHAPPVHTKVPETEKATVSAQPVPHKQPNPQGYSVMMVPGMGKDRKEALRKLGLLKDC